MKHQIGGYWKNSSETIDLTGDLCLGLTVGAEGLSCSDPISNILN